MATIDDEIEDLPDEMLLQIFASSEPATVALLSRVSRRFRAIATDPVGVLAAFDKQSIEARNDLIVKLAARESGARLFVQFGLRRYLSRVRFNVPVGSPRAVVGEFLAQAGSANRDDARRFMAAIFTNLVAATAVRHDAETLMNIFSTRMAPYLPYANMFPLHNDPFPAGEFSTPSRLDSMLSLIIRDDSPEGADWPAGVRVLLLRRRDDKVVFRLPALTELVTRGAYQSLQVIVDSGAIPAATADGWSFFVVELVLRRAPVEVLERLAASANLHATERTWIGELATEAKAERDEALRLAAAVGSQSKPPVAPVDAEISRRISSVRFV
ncbi:MAG TPA: F-box protein [Gemmatimonadaceae bacterium]|jgi:hypothetical protein|nr:F-box protein [Gemmatimonadaceae bacterium]